VEQAKVQRDWPDTEATRQRAFKTYEDALKEKNA